MSDVERALAATAYALFALEQPLSLDAVEAGARAGVFPAAATHTPEWFAAAAEGSDLIEMAPELQVLPTDLDVAQQVDLTGIDLIHVYAPEMTGAARPEANEEPEAVAEEAQEEPAESARPEAPRPGAATQIGLLKELGGLDD
jgi:hypothetical protein